MSKRIDFIKSVQGLSQADLVARRVNAARNDAPLVSVQAARVA